MVHPRPDAESAAIIYISVSEDMDRKTNPLAVFPETHPIHHARSKLLWTEAAKPKARGTQG